MTELVLLEREGDIARVVLNRPDRLNAFNLDMWRRLGAVMAEVEAEAGLRCLVVSGGTSKAFGAGADIAEFPQARFSAAQAEAYAGVMAPALESLEACAVPTVAAVQGACVGAGLELALLCDLKIAGAGARFGIPIKRIGHCLPYAAMRPLVALVGQTTAMEILLEGRILDAEEAQAKGLVNRVVPDEAVETEAMATARRIAEGAPLAARGHKRFVRRAADPRPLSEAEWREPFQSCDSADYHEGVRAFLDKRKPAFEGQ
ncbi:MAG: enoyl-CoA hydratase-related protein [Kiloniellales bacterium]|nr:enoyl-CoA hydratase-related protein [Kiloniellales bacterium]